MRKVILLIGGLCLLVSSVWAQHLRGSAASDHVPGASHVWIKKGQTVPAFVRFHDHAQPALSEVADQITHIFGLMPGVDSWQKLSSDIDLMGHQHDRFQQYFQGYPVEGSMFLVHSHQGKVYAINGDLYRISHDAENYVAMDANVARDNALEAVDAQLYKWQVVGEENYLRRMHQEDPVAFPQSTYYPQGELVWVPNQGDYQQADFRLAYRFNVYAQVPVMREHVYVDARHGMVIDRRNLIHTADSAGTATTRYSGTQSIIADNFMGSFRLRESGRGDGVETYDMNEGTNYGASTDFVDNDNIWDFAGAPALENAAADAHWGAEVTYDYFLNNFNRNSINNNGFRLLSYVHYDNAFNNAFWDGQRMTYGDGNNRPLTAIDVTGHEITHGLTTFTANLIYQNESGALNESFSDIFGKAIENAGRPNNFSWNIGADIGAFRDMANPNRFNDPKNYFGTDWFTGAGDNGGVHINSGVQNHWFYLLVEGGIGQNDFNENYDVASIGWDTAAAIAFRNLTVYLTPSSNYADAAFYAEQSAIDLYGACTKYHEATVNAWHAVGIGRPFSFEPVSSFDAANPNICSQPYQVRFLDETQSADTYTWDFGDGGSSADASPIHTYVNPGQYNITLTITGICGGADTLVKTNYVNVTQAPAAPSIAAVQPLNCRDKATLQATGSNVINWYNDRGEFIATGPTFQTPSINRTTRYSARNIDFGNSQLVGPKDWTIGQNGNHNTQFEARILFSVLKNCRFSSAWVQSSVTGPRDFFLEDAQGNLLQTITVNIPTGVTRVDFNLDLTPGDYRIGGSFMNLTRNQAGATYPYDLAGLVSLTGSSAGPGSYYYLYDWEINETCASAFTDIDVQVIPLSDPQATDATRCGPGSVSLSATHNQGGDINWYDANGNLLGRGPLFTTPFLGTSNTYFAEAEVGPAPQQVGPVSPNVVGGGGYHDSGFESRLFFEVAQPIRLKSVLVDANTGGTRTIVLEDDQGTLISQTPINIPAGLSRVTLDLDLQPGNYAIGGSNMDLYRNNVGAVYPYEISGLVSITGSNANTSDDFYYYFYDWEVQEAPCYSNRVAVQANITSGTGPTAQFTSTPVGASIQFTDVSSNNVTAWLWDFGDGNTSTQQNPTHTYATPGTYTVTLVVDDGVCSESFSTGVVAEFAVNIDVPQAVTWSLFPNPGKGTFVVSAKPAQPAPAQLIVFNAMGQQVWQQDVAEAAQQRVTVDLRGMAQGTYFVQWQTMGERFTRKYVLQ